MASLSKSEYLKRYVSGDAVQNEKKKKKKRKLDRILKTHSRMKIFDDDVDLKQLTPGNLGNTLEEDVGDNDPTIAEVIDDRPEHIKREETYGRDDRWKTLGAQDDDRDADDDYQARRKNKLSNNKNALRHDSDSDRSPIRSRKGRNDSDSDQSPVREIRHDSDSDHSPIRKGRHDSDSDHSPVRKGRHDSDSDQSPIRKGRHDSDSDQSPLRQQNSHDRQYQQTTNKQESDSDLSPQRKRKTHSDSDQSPPRKRKTHSDSDQSPPRKQKTQSDSDQSPPRKRKTHSDSDQSPPRKRKTYSDSDQSPPRKRKPHSESDQSPSRKRKHKREEDSSHRISKDGKPKPGKTLSGAKAGLSSARDLRREAETLRKRHDDAFSKIDADLLGRNAKTVFRDRKTGKRRNMDKEKAEQEAEDEKKKEEDRKYEQWGKGLKQQSEREEFVTDTLHEMSKPLARGRDDSDLDAMLRKMDRDGDPMAAFITKKQTSKKNERPRYKGPFPPNRFGICPGYRWDGVDRSNGFEKQYFSKMSDRRAVKDMAYKWSTEDM